MKISVYDTYVKKNNSTIMHFDILVEESKTVEEAIAFGKEYLVSKSLSDGKLTTKECTFCHIETAPIEIEKAVLTDGYYILEMENC
ncbi:MULTISPECIES: DUF2024 family protein [Flavobacteriaceae]|jgi:hypothetical protein|uniref:DUF2024 family protein n=1 Tax=Flavobacteriaceae TaxID=49546 RepID=UPI001C4FB73C|nr:MULTISPECIES: DUF2024 family protein [Flavobacteriaceae]MDO7138898.1 DUF2024 family protein [Algibacter lectus]QXP68489.1 DUF2024 family protein [Polaribacter sp. AHE13PA]QXP70686.1 DUF2024 family protein [Polaribacter sp. R2A056_3_33]